MTRSTELSVYSNGMEMIILIAGFLGGWLLVAGSVYQAALEMLEQDIGTDELREAGSKVEKPPRVSAWWWLVPPIRLYLAKRRRDAYMQSYFASLDAVQSEALTSYFHKSTAWLYVGIGSFLLATKETYELLEHAHILMGFLILIIFVLLVLSVFNTAIRIRHTEQLLESKKK